MTQKKTINIINHPSVLDSIPTPYMAKTPWKRELIINQ